MPVPTWLVVVLVGVMLAIAATHAVHLAARSPRLDAHSGGLFMALAMIAMLLDPSDAALLRALAVLAVIPALWFTGATIAGYINQGAIGIPRPACDALCCASMLYMLMLAGAAVPAATPSMPGMTMPGAGTALTDLVPAAVVAMALVAVTSLRLAGPVALRAAGVAMAATTGYLLITMA
jgi:hypothetical protein